MASKTLITAWEVVKFSPAGDNFPASRVVNAISQVEQKLRRTIIGAEYYDQMLEDVNEFIGVEEWTPKTYQSNDKALYLDTFIYSLIDDNDTDPAEDSDGTKWAVSDKFSNEAYQELWEKHLRAVIAYLVMSKSNIYATYQLGAKGSTEEYSDSTGTRTASNKTFLGVQGQLVVDAQELIENMKFFLEKNASTYAGVKHIADVNKGKTVIQPGRRFYTRTKRRQSRC